MEANIETYRNEALVACRDFIKVLPQSIAVHYVEAKKEIKKATTIGQIETAMKTARSFL